MKFFAANKTYLYQRHEPALPINTVEASRFVLLEFSDSILVFRQLLVLKQLRKKRKHCYLFLKVTGHLP